MRFHRPLLYAGVFLAAIGGVGLAADAGLVDTTALTWPVRLWPLAIIVVGLALVLRRTRFRLAGGLAAAAMPGLLLGSTFAVLPRITEHCGSTDVPVNVAPQAGAFTEAALVSVETGCGTLTMRTAPGGGWQVEAGNTAGLAPSVVAAHNALSVSPGDTGWYTFAGGRDDWTITLPTTQLATLHLDINTGRGSVNLAGARLEGLVVESDMAEVLVDASAATMGAIVASVDFGHLSLVLPPGRDIEGHLEVDAGDIDLCIPADAGLRLTTRGSPRAVTFEGVRQANGEWLSPGYASAAYHFELVAAVSLGSIDINPIGGCR